MPKLGTNTQRPETLVAQAGGAIDAATGGVVPAHQPSTTFVRDEDYRLASPTHLYGRDDNDAARQAESVIARLENAEAALLFPSGMAAIAAAMRTVADGGAIVLQSGIYWGTTKWVREHCARHGIRLAEVDATDAEALAGAIAAANPDLVFIEVPSNPWLGIVDIARAADRARAVDAKLVVDLTAATPCSSARSISAPTSSCIPPPRRSTAIPTYLPACSPPAMPHRRSGLRSAPIATMPVPSSAPSRPGC